MNFVYVRTKTRFMHFTSCSVMNASCTLKFQYVFCIRVSCVECSVLCSGSSNLFSLLSVGARTDTTLYRYISIFRNPHRTPTFRIVFHLFASISILFISICAVIVVVLLLRSNNNWNVYRCSQRRRRNECDPLHIKYLCQNWLRWNVCVNVWTVSRTSVIYSFSFIRCYWSTDKRYRSGQYHNTSHRQCRISQIYL